MKSGFSQKNSLDLLTTNTTFTLQKLTLRVRNTSSIGVCAPEEISELGKAGENSQTHVISGASASSVVGMRPTFIHIEDIAVEKCSSPEEMKDALFFTEGIREALSGALKFYQLPQKSMWRSYVEKGSQLTMCLKQPPY